MKIIELTELQFKNYSKIHSMRNYFQTIEYADFEKENGYNKLLLGLIDDNNNLCAATLILLKELKGKYKVGIVPNGYLINYNNSNLFEDFTKELKKYLDGIDVIYIKVKPLVKYKIFDKDNNILHFDTAIIDKFKQLGYIHLGFNDSFDRFKVILETDSSINSTYEKFNRNTKRNIKYDNNMGISIYKGDFNNIELFYSLIRKKESHDLEYYKRIYKYFNNDDNKFELYFSKIEPTQYINNYRFLLKKESEKNEKLNKKLQSGIKISDNLINKKMLSDKLIAKYNKEIIRATNIYKNFPKGLVVGTCAIIRNNREVYFLADGYEEKMRYVNSSHMLKWEIIKKYMNLGYNIFDFGNISPNRNKENNKYYGLYLSKIGFNGYVIEYPGEFDLPINNVLYKIFKNLLKK